MNYFKKMIHDDTSVELSLNSITFEELLSTHFLCDADFDPALSSIVDIKSYCEKLYQKAEIITAKIDKRIVGIIAMYCNDQQSGIGYISSVCVISKYRGKGIAKMLLIKSDELALQKHMVLLRLEVGKNNLNAKKIYSNHGYFFESNGVSTIFMRKSLKK